MPEKFDFSKIEDQQKFDNLNSEEKSKEILYAQVEALEMTRLIKDGQVQSYQEAERRNKGIKEAKEKLIMNLNAGDIHSARRIVDNFAFQQELLVSSEVQAAAKKSLFAQLIERNIDRALQIKEHFALSPEFLFSPEVLAATKKSFIDRLKFGVIHDVLEIKDSFAFPAEFITSTEVIAAAREGFIRALKIGMYGALRIKDNFVFPPEFITSPEVIAAAKEGVIERFKREGLIKEILEIKDYFALQEDFILAAAKKGLIEKLKWGNITEVLEIKDSFAFPAEFITSTEVIAAAKEGLIKIVIGGNTEGVLKIKDSFALSPEAIQAAAKEGLIIQLKAGDIYYAIKTKDDFALQQEFLVSPEVLAAAKEGLIIQIKNLDMDRALRIKDSFALSPEAIQAAAKEGVIEQLIGGRVYEALELKENFNLAITTDEIISRIPELSELFKLISEYSPQFYVQAMRSVDISIALTRFMNEPDKLLQAIQKNPFLPEAINANPRYGAKLLIKFPSFDDYAQSEIRELHKNKSSILQDNPGIDSQSVEFRVLMQERIKDYGNNKETIKAIKEKGVNEEVWLNYDEVAYFNLDTGGKQLDFSEAVAAPIKRIKETIEQYAYTVKSVLKEYRKELTDFQIPAEDTSPIEEQIKKLEEEKEKALAAGNDKKAEGIGRGIDGLRQKIDGVKTMPLWEKLTGQIDGFSRLKDDLFVAQEKLIQADKDLAEKLSSKQPSGKLIQELKQKINTAKEELRTKLKTLELRIENFKDNLSIYLETALTKDRADALIQEIELKLAEQFNHYDTDRGTLSNLFADNQKEKSDRDKMENQPMSVFVWARNPDIDLYQGNYSPCCICIESNFHGAESPIADYATDLGIQIVNIWDETKNEPVVAAWCFLGEDDKGEPVLVIDNIEANTTYSANFSEQLTKELFGYIKNYAAAIGANKVVLGKANNDLPTASELAKVPEASSRYNKIGAYNRPDGYFLEAEGKSVKLVWEKTIKSTQTAKAEKNPAKKIERIKFEGIKVEDLSEKDFEIVKKLEKKIYEADGLVQGEELITELKEGNGLSYSVIVRGSRPGKKANEAVGYIIAVEDETDEGDPSIYLEDIALVPEAQGQQLGWEMLKKTITKLKAKTARDGKPVLFDMHLRENSQRFMEHYHNDLEQMGVKLIESVLIPDYYEDGNDALYKVYQIDVIGVN